GIDHTFDRVFHVLGRHLATVVELHALAQLEGEGRPVFRDFVALREIGTQRGRPGLIIHEPVEQALDHRPVLPVVADGRVKRGDIVLVGDDDFATWFGVGVAFLGHARAGRDGKHQRKRRGRRRSCQKTFQHVGSFPSGYLSLMRGSMKGAMMSARKLPSTIANADTSVTPMMIGMSTRWMACQTSWPIPGQPNTLSTTTMPPMSMPMSMPIMAMMGRMAFGRAWRMRTVIRASPLARAVRI